MRWVRDENDGDYMYITEDSSPIAHGWVLTQPYGKGFLACFDGQGQHRWFPTEEQAKEWVMVEYVSRVLS